MFVVIADQIGSRTDRDRVADLLHRLDARAGDRLALPAERTAGDELQALTADPTAALDIVLECLRGGHFRAGLGIGHVAGALPASIREASGPAFIAGRRAVQKAARTSIHFAAAGADTAADDADDVDALIALLLTGRARWSAQSWELYDLLEQGLTQAAAAERLGITPQAVSKRARAAALAIDAEARRAIARLMDSADAEHSTVG
ncbi:SatD family protein [Microcella alkaliphila]|uniref:SatD family protein n=1 Tax=Microcella alkaliphila TaxID=279828 RepID=A0A4Q7TPT4_9MICO|nr:SatD family protein [Microcella alkaliphila]RZT62593.1 SatD family protein [Microcella alkaliphila]